MKTRILLSFLVTGLCCSFFYGRAQSLQSHDDEQYDEVIIRRKGDLPSQLTIQLDGEKVLINGKKPGEEGGQVEVIRKRYSGDADAAPFRSFGSAIPRRPFGGMALNGNKALLGVVTSADSEETAGATIMEVEKGTPADSAGLQEGDLITAVDGDSVDSPDALSRLIGQHEPGDQVTISYIRDAAAQKVTVVLAQNDNQGPGFRFGGVPMDRFHFPQRLPMPPSGVFSYGRPRPMGNGPRLGMTVENRDDGKGVTVMRVRPGSPAEQSGFRPDDILTDFAGKKVKDVDDVTKALAENRKTTTIEAKVLRDGKSRSLTVTLPHTQKQANL